jgi:hypothetical protein
MYESKQDRYESKQDSEVKRILEAAKNMPFRFNKNKNVSA